MDKNQAILRIKDIQNGNFDHLNQFPNALKGSVPVYMYKNDINFKNAFDFGFEYGEIWGLIKGFDIKVQDLK